MVRASRDYKASIAMIRFARSASGSSDTLMLVGATVFAFLFAYKRKIALHRQLATCSYAIALVFIAGRFVSLRFVRDTTGARSTKSHEF